MSKSTMKYWNVLAAENSRSWQVIDGSAGMMEQLTLAVDPDTGDYTRLTRMKAGVNTEVFGKQSHEYPEEIYIVSGRMYDQAFEQWLETGHYASRPAGEVHGPFYCEQDCLVLEISYLSQIKHINMS